MSTIIKKIDRNKIEQEIIDQAGEILKKGGLVAFPTETVYGLGANALDEEAAKKTYEAKGRPSDNPLIVHIANMEDLEEIVVEIPADAKAIAKKFWPGPLTMIFEKKECVPLGTTGGLQTVAVRMPDDVIAQEVIRSAGGYVSAPSANTSGRPSPTTAQHVEEDLSGKIDMILDGGSVEIGVESTILDMTVVPPMILRPGAITKEMLEEVVGKIDVDITLVSDHSDQAPKAPGMKYRHYAPKAEMTIVEGERSEAIKAISQLAYEKTMEGCQVGIIATKESAECYNNGIIKVIGSRENEKSVARNLYRILREFDEEQVDFIYSEAFSEDGIGTAVMNRLGKAAGHHVIQADVITRNQKYRKIIFVSSSGNCRAPISAELLKKEKLLQEYQIEARGMVVLFPEPLNPKAEEMLKKNGKECLDFETKVFSEDEVDEETLILTMQAEIKEKLLNQNLRTEHIFTLCEYIEEDKEITSAYGKAEGTYEEMYELIQIYIKKLANKLNRISEK